MTSSPERRAVGLTIGNGQKVSLLRIVALLAGGGLIAACAASPTAQPVTISMTQTVTATATTNAQASPAKSQSQTASSPKASSKPSPKSAPTKAAPAPLVSKPKSTPTKTKSPAPATDPDYGTCKNAKAHGKGPYYRGKDPEYYYYRDADHDGIVCE